MTTHTTNHLRLTWRDHTRRWLTQRDPIAITGVLALALIIVLSSLRSVLPPQPAAAAVPTAQLPIIMFATVLTEPPPPPVADRVSAVLPGTLPRAVVAYDSPNGRVIGAIDSGHAYQVVARYGADWLQADVAGSGVVWLRAADVTGLPSDLADLQPAAQARAPAQYQIESVPVAQPTLTADERQQALGSEFGLTDADRAAAFAAQQAREAAWATGQSATPVAVPPPLTSEDLPCHCP